MNLWRWLRQSDRIAGLEQALEIRIQTHQTSQKYLATAHADLDRERSLRITAEVLSVERKNEVERLVGELSAVRGELNDIMHERLRSLDTLNVKLMTERAEEKLPDMAQYKKSEAAGASAMNAIRSIRQIHHNMDTAILTKLHPKFAKVAGAVMNEPMAEAPSGS